MEGILTDHCCGRVLGPAGSVRLVAEGVESVDAWLLRGLAAKGPEGLIPIAPEQLRARLWAYELLAEGEGLPIARVFAFVATDDERPVRAAIGHPPGSGQHVVLLEAGAFCPLQRLALFEHEAHHLRARDNGDWSEQAEAKAEAAALVALAKWTRFTEAKVALDRGACAACYQQGARSCAQGERVLEAVKAVLAPL